MAARPHAAASLCPDRTVFSCFLSCESQCFCTSSSRLSVLKRAYSREFLLDVSRAAFLELNSAHAELLRDLGLLRRPTSSPTPTTASRPQRRRHKRRERKQKRGKRGGIRARLTANPHKPSIPTMVLANVRSLDNKLDYIRLLRSTQRTVRDCCVFVFTETWLSDSVPDCAIQLDQLTCYRADRARVAGGKTRGGGLCVYINDAWCRDAVVICKHCSPLVEFMIIKCRPFYLPREYTAILLVSVYIPPNNNISNRNDALNELHQHISDQQTAHPDAFLIIAGDFNHADLKSVFPKIHQHINFPTRGNNILDFVYTTQRGAYKALPLPHLGASDHITVMLMPAYRPLVKVAKPVQKQIQVWPEGSSEALQDCFDTTDWNMFKQAATYNNSTDLQEYSETVTAYITKCIEDVTVTKTITVRANQKPWMTGEVYRLLETRNAAFRAGDEGGLRTARANLSRGIREAKRQYSRRIAHQFSDSRDTRSLWQGIQTITDYKPPQRTCDSNISLLNELNTFFARFEAQNSSTAQKTPPPPSDQVMMLTPDSVRRSFSRINARKAPGPDNIPGRVLRDCAAELTDVFTDIFNISLSQAVVPTCFKATTIIPVPKKPSPSCFNDYRPVALTPILMKCFERLVMHHIKSAPPSLDPFQFAYRSNRSTDDAISTTLHSALTHLEKKDSYVRMLFIDFSSAFNTIIPQQLIHKLVELGLNTSLCNWLLDFLTGRPQAVRVGSNTSSTITLNTGAPQGCVLSPLLFTLLTHDCTPSHNSNLFIKFADDTTVVGLISNRDETNYRSEVSRLAGWCSDNNLSLNVEKTKEIVVDFRRAHTQHVPLTINGATVERVSSTKFLGVHITEDLSWTDNTAALAKKSQQRLYFLRKLRRARAPPPIMYTFYRGTIESILTSCITVWYGACNVSCRKTLQRIVRAAEKIIGVSLPSLQDIYGTRLTRKALCIAGDPTHPSHSFFSLLPSGRRLRSLQARTSRLKDSFIHQAVRKLNSLPNLPPRPPSASGTTEL
uniref:Reverse transcriptase domain-containing protein n=1 Tax=Cyprinus carpio carpio TaxID=630221 RepID=A0A9J7ZV96_CYPCA